MISYITNHTDKYETAGLKVKVMLQFILNINRHPSGEEQIRNVQSSQNDVMSNNVTVHNIRTHARHPLHLYVSLSNSAQQIDTSCIWSSVYNCKCAQLTAQTENYKPK